jgi:hypothetical protein
VSHLVVGLELPSAAGLPFWSPSLLLYKGFGADTLLLSGVPGCGEESADLGAEERSSIIT